MKANLDYCNQALREVSRTFALPIEALPEPLRRTVTCGYLLCRVADTLEDHPALAHVDPDVAFSRLRAALDAGTPEALAAFAASTGPVSPDDAELALLVSVGRVVSVVHAELAGARPVLSRWIGELSRGMALYVARPRRPDGLRQLEDLADLERYCYFVAGTVGRMLTALFLDALPALAHDRRVALETHAEALALGLQLVNVLKDIGEDLGRGECYVPRALLAAHGLDARDLAIPAHHAAAHQALEPLFVRAWAALDGGLAYALAVPADAAGIRTFCLLPMWLAARTLELARGSDAIFGGGVKIDRAEVASLCADCAVRVGDDDALRAGWRRISGSRW